jgi:hypothetical protein
MIFFNSKGDKSYPFTLKISNNPNPNVDNIENKISDIKDQIDNIDIQGKIDDWIAKHKPTPPHIKPSSLPPKPTPPSSLPYSFPSSLPSSLPYSFPLSLPENWQPNR